MTLASQAISRATSQILLVKEKCIKETGNVLNAEQLLPRCRLNQTAIGRFSAVTVIAIKEIAGHADSINLIIFSDYKTINKSPRINRGFCILEINDD